MGSLSWLSSWSATLISCLKQGLGPAEYHEGEESGDDLDEGEDEEDMGGYLLVAQPR